MTPEIIYFTSTGKSVIFLNKCKKHINQLVFHNGEYLVAHPHKIPKIFYLLVPSYQPLPKWFGDAQTILKNSHGKCKGIIITGNINFGALYGNVGKLLNQEFNIPIVHKMENTGTDKDILFLNQLLKG